MKLELLHIDGKVTCCVTTETVGEASALAVLCTQMGWENAPPVESGASANLNIENVLAQCKLEGVTPAPPIGAGSGDGNPPKKDGNPDGNGDGNPPEKTGDRGGK